MTRSRRIAWIGLSVFACGSRSELDTPYAQPDAHADAIAELDADADAPASGVCEGVSLLVNCSFELPPVKTGGLQIFAEGQQLPGWTVIGQPVNVNTISTTFTQNGFAFPAQEGAQSMDLTGFSNTNTGVSQTITTIAGASYDLTFWVGNIVDPNGIFGVSSTIDVRIDGAHAFSATTANGAGTHALAWKNFSFSFVATSDTTTIAFMNADSSSDTSNFVDDVVLISTP